MNRNINDLSGLRYTKKGKDILMKNVQKSVDKKENNVINIKPFSKVAVIAATMCFATVTAYATGVFQSAADIFAPMFGGSESQAEIIGQMGHVLPPSSSGGVVEASSSTSNGITISAKAVLGDSKNLCIIYDIKNEDGTQINLPDGVSADSLFTGSIFDNNETFIPGTQLPKTAGDDLSSSGSRYFKEDENGGLQFIERITTEGKIPVGETVTAGFRVIEYVIPKGESFEVKTLAEGDWNLEYTLDYQDLSRVYSVNKTNEIDEYTYNIESLVISPLSFELKYVVDGEMEYKEIDAADVKEEDFFIDYGNNKWLTVDENVSVLVDDTEDFTVLTGVTPFQRLDIILTLKDGTEMDLTYSASNGLNSADGQTFIAIANMFDEIIPLEDMLSVSIGDEIIFID